MQVPVLLLSWKRTFRPRTVGETVPLSFEVPPGIERLEIRCSLSPGFCRDAEADVRAVRSAAEKYARQAEPLQQLSPDEIIRMRGMEKLLAAVANLLNVTVHDPSERYLGRWDAPDKEHAPPMFIGPHGSSPGFVTAAIAAGTWRLVVEAWYIFHQPAVATLEILGHFPGGPGTNTPQAPRQAGPGTNTPQARRTVGSAEATQPESFAPTRGDMLPPGGPGTNTPQARRTVGSAEATQPESFAPTRGDMLPPGGPGRGQETPRRVRKVGFRPPRLRMPGVFLGEMHSHTRHSDGIYGVDEQAERAAALGLDFIALTDHNTTSGHAEFSPDAPVTQIPGEEMTTFFGHFCNYGVTRCHEWHDIEGRQRIRMAIAEATAEGALPSLAHPHAIDPPACVGCGFRKGTVPYREFCLLEVWSGAWKVRSPEIVATRLLWDRLWARGTRLVPIAARDWHSERQEDTPSVRFPATALFAEKCDPASILAALRAGRVFTTSGPMVHFAAQSDGRIAGIGESLASLGGAATLLEAKLELPERTSGILSILCNGRAMAGCSLDRAIEASFCFETRGKGSFRVEVWSTDGELLLLTNHVCIT